MSKRILVDPEKLITASGNIATIVGEYIGYYGQLYKEVDAMAAGWKGKDNLEFTARIKDFQKDFKAMEQVLKAYSDYLKVSGDNYNKTQEGLTNMVKTLVK
ncbi:WXG100 family type VII secretion target [Paenibacillus sp. L3-i20]|uniref:WXG100 family type VII secretion target n=1 Tax=Paenibacillus sp. L3-i20 TaxID=2905833 RepID=UPI001EDF1F34|nr:WXG100 family type VII secretion target [Paenibacillus sp. L3-i20]GKU77585.1 hypothetical protein L3i20_v219820 [Paenibacillus sp. L3-i20]